MKIQQKNHIENVQEQDTTGQIQCIPLIIHDNKFVANYWEKVEVFDYF